MGFLVLGIMEKMNEAFLMKMLWNMINKLDDIWCKVIYSKYGRNNDLQVAITSQPYNSPYQLVYGTNFKDMQFGRWEMINE